MTLIEKLEAAEAEAARLRIQNAKLKAKLYNTLVEAKAWKMEALCHKSSLHTAYQAVTGATGEPGDWNGANPIIKALKAREVSDA